jgi:pyruvate formate lyase activating enzyme
LGEAGRLHWYFDPLPTNCVADWVCAGGSDAGYPGYSCRRGPETGYNNLAVFYGACTFDCLFCQNWSYRRLTLETKGGRSVEELASAVDARTACICYFGGDPTPQLDHALAASRVARERNRNRILRICWETNGAMHKNLLRKMTELSLETGGTVKFDLKAWTAGLHRALTGVDNDWTFANFSRAAQRISERPDPPLLVASTLLVPGYIDADEVGRIARFIAEIDPDIPYSLLAFHPDFLMDDLPVTSVDEAEACLAAAETAGLSRVRLGNRHLLGRKYDRRNGVE